MPRHLVSAIAICMVGLCGCTSSRSAVIDDKLSVQSLKSENGFQSTTVYDTSSGDRVFRTSELDEKRQSATVYVGGKEHVTLFHVETGNPDLVGVAIGGRFPQIRVVGVDVDGDESADYLRVDLPSGEKEFRSYFDLDRDGIFDAMQDPFGKRLWVLASNRWIEVVFEPEELLSKDGYQATPVDTSSGDKMYFEDGVWKVNK